MVPKTRRCLWLFGCYGRTCLGVGACLEAIQDNRCQPVRLFILVRLGGLRGYV